MFSLITLCVVTEQPTDHLVLKIEIRALIESQYIVGIQKHDVK